MNEANFEEVELSETRDPLTSLILAISASVLLWILLLSIPTLSNDYLLAVLLISIFSILLFYKILRIPRAKVLFRKGYRLVGYSYKDSSGKTIPLTMIPFDKVERIFVVPRERFTKEVKGKSLVELELWKTELHFLFKVKIPKKNVEKTEEIIISGKGYDYEENLLTLLNWGVLKPSVNSEEIYTFSR